MHVGTVQKIGSVSDAAPIFSTPDELLAPGAPCRDSTFGSRLIGGPENEQCVAERGIPVPISLDAPLHLFAGTE